MTMTTTKPTTKIDLNNPPRWIRCSMIDDLIVCTTGTKDNDELQKVLLRIDPEIVGRGDEIRKVWGLLNYSERELVVRLVELMYSDEGC